MRCRGGPARADQPRSAALIAAIAASAGGAVCSIRYSRDRIFAEMTPEWKDAYAAGIFTEFMEQRAPGHTVLGDVIYRKGLAGASGGYRRRKDSGVTTGRTFERMVRPFC